MKIKISVLKRSPCSIPFLVLLGGKLFVWGDNSYGQLGLGTRQPAFLEKPTEMTSLRGLPVMRLACGGAHTFVVSTSGTIFGWGRNHCGQLGVSDTKGK